MSKFCGNCGAEMDDFAKICGECGMSLEEEKHTNFKFFDPEKNKKVKKIVISVAIAAVVVVGVVFGIKFALSFVGYKGEVKKFMEAYKADDPDAIVELENGAIDSLFDVDDYLDNKSKTYENYLDYEYDKFDDKMDSNYKISYKITKCQDINKGKVEDALALSATSSNSDEEEEIIEDYVAGLSEMKKVTLEITAKSGKKEKTFKETLILVKDDSGWLLLQWEAPKGLNSSDYDY